MKTSDGTGEKKPTSLELIEKGSIPVTIIRLALPMMIGMIAQLIYNMTDTFFIGRTGDPNMVAGISLTFPVFMLSQGIGSIFGVGTSSYISRMLGEKRPDEAGRANAAAFWTNAAAGIFLSIVLWVFKTPILRLIGTSEGTFYHADRYFSVITIFMVFSMLSVALSGQTRSEGAAGKAMIGMLLGIVLNIVLDPVFIFVFNWGAAGAAWATIIGNAVSVCYFILYFVSGNSVLSVRPGDFKPNKRMYREIIRIGFPAALQNIIMSVALVFNNILAAGYGDYVVAGNGISFRIVTVAFMLVMALAMGFQPFAGYNYGAKNFGRIRGGFIITAAYTTLLAWIFFGLYRIGGSSIIRLFIKDPLTVDAGTRIMNAFTLGVPFLGLQMTMSIAFQSFGKSREAAAVTVVRPLIYIPALYIFDFLWGFNGFIYAWAAADIVTTATAVLLGIPLFKEIDLFANATAKVKREKIMQDTIKKELVRLIFRSKNIGLRFPAAIGGSAGGAGNVPDINMAEAALMKGIADETLGSEGAKIQEALCINKAAVSQMLGVLERKGYISRETNRDNRRKIILTLTAKGHKAVQDTGRTVDALLSEIINRFGKNDTEQFIRQFNRFADIVAELIKQPEP